MGGVIQILEDGVGCNTGAGDWGRFVTGTVERGGWLVTQLLGNGVCVCVCGGGGGVTQIGTWGREFGRGEGGGGRGTSGVLVDGTGWWWRRGRSRCRRGQCQCRVAEFLHPGHVLHVGGVGTHRRARHPGQPVIQRSERRQLRRLPHRRPPLQVRLRRRLALRLLRLGYVSGTSRVRLYVARVEVRVGSGGVC